jgi:transmembrane sensor
VRAVGTAFAIALKSDEVNVVVTQGRVAVDHATTFATAQPSAATAFPTATGAALDAVAAGNLIVMERAPRGASSPAPVLPVVRPAVAEELEATLGWRIPRLEFSGTLLPEVVKAMNRYNRVQFTIADASLGVLRLSGALRADKIEVLVEILEADFPVKAERRGQDEIVLRRAR